MGTRVAGASGHRGDAYQGAGHHRRRRREREDPQGAVIPGASVVLISDARATRVAETVTNTNGDYVFPNVPGDTYTVQVTLEGFKMLRRGGIAISPGDRVTVPAMTLQVVYTGRNTTLQLVSPTNQTVRNAQYLANGDLNSSRLTPRTAGFGAATGAAAMRSVQVQLRLQF